MKRPANGDQQRDWEATAPEGVLAALGVSTISDDKNSRALRLLLSDPATCDFLHVEALVSDSDGQPLPYLIPRTRIFVNRERARELRGDVFAGLAVWVLSHSLTWSAGVMLFRRAVATVKLLSDAELDIVAIITGINSADGTIAPVPTARILAAYEGRHQDLTGF